MFIGHFAVAFAARPAARRVSFAALLTASLLPDLLWPVFILAGWERVRVDPGNTAFTPLAFEHYPVSHSLATTLAFAGAAALLFRAWTAGGAVISHWVLDFISHRPDLPLYPGSAVFAGLGLWNSIPGTLLVEGGMFVAAVWFYLRATRASDRIGRYGAWSFLALLAALYIASIAGPPPPSARAVALADLAGLPLLAWAAWFDRHRRPKTAP